MHKPTLHCFGGSWGENDPLRERRVVWDDKSPEAKGSAGDSRERIADKARDRERLDQMDAILRQAAAGHPHREVIMRDAEESKMIKGYPEFAKEGDGVFFLKKSRYAEHWHEAYTEGSEKIQKIQDDVAREADILRERARKALERMEKTQKFPGLMPSLQRFDEIDIQALIDAWQKNLADNTGKEKQIAPTDELTKGFSEAEEKILKKLLGDPDTKTPGKIDRLLKKLDEDKKILIRDHFKGRGEYFQMISGMNAARFIGSAFDPKNGSFNVAALRHKLRLRGKEITLAALQRDAGILDKASFPTLLDTGMAEWLKKIYDIDATHEQLKELAYILLTQGKEKLLASDAWKTVCEQSGKEVRDIDATLSRLSRIWDQRPLLDLLKELGIQDDAPGVSFWQILYRSQLPEGMTEDIVKIEKTVETHAGGISLDLIRSLAQEAEYVDTEKTNVEFDSAKLAELLLRKLFPKTKKDTYEYRQDDLEEALTLLWLNPAAPAAARDSAREFLTGDPVREIIPQKKSANQTVLLDEKQKKAFQEKLKDILSKETYKISPAMTRYLTEIKRKEVLDAPLTDRLHLTFREAVATLKVGGAAWLAYVKELPDNFYALDLDAKLLDLIEEENALKEYRNGLRGLERTLTASRTFLERKNKETGSIESDRTKAADPMKIAVSRGEKVEQGGFLLDEADYVLKSLRPHWAASAVEERKKAFCIGMDVGIEEALAYIQSTDKKLPSGYSPESRIAEMHKRSAAEGRDILESLRVDFGITVDDYALKTLRETKDTDGTPLTEGNARVSEWLIHPKEARPALEAILHGNEDAVAAFIASYCAHDERKVFKDPRGKDVTIPVARATEEVTKIHHHLERQSRERALMDDQLKNPERMSDPLERGFRGGLEMLRNLWDGDWIDKAKIAAIICAGVWVIRDQWAKGKEEGWRRGIIAGIPLLIAANTLYKQKTGKDLMGEKLLYRSPEERGSAFEQFRGRASALKEFEDLSLNVQNAAMAELLSSSDPITITELLEWKKSIEAPGEKIFDPDKVPGNLNISRIRPHLGSNASPKRATEAAFTVFTALAYNLAIMRGDTGDPDALIANGMHILEEEAEKNPGITMADVIIGKSRTPDMQTKVLGDETIMEAVGNLVGKEVEAGKNLTKRIFVASTVVLVDVPDQMRRLYEETKPVVLETGEKLYDWVRVTGAKSYAELSEDLKASWDFIAGTGKALGLTIVNHGPSFIDWGISAGATAGNFSVDLFQALGRELHRHQITGNFAELVDKICARFKLPTPTRLVLLRSTVERDHEHVEKLADRRKWIADLVRQVGTVVAPPTDLQVQTWIIKTYEKEFLEQEIALTQEDASRGLEKIDIFDRQAAHIRMATYELIKRRVYSQMIARRIQEYRGLPLDQKPPYPLTFIWPPDITPNDGSLEHAIDKSYGMNTLRLFGAEHTLAGSIDAWAKEQSPGKLRTALEFLHWSLDWITRDEATEYLVHSMNEYLHPFLMEAEKRWKDDPDKRRKYKSYLETLVTNAVIELSLGAREAAEIRVPKERMTFALTIEQAKDALEYFHAIRGSAADLEVVKDLNFTGFSSVTGAPAPLSEVLKDDALMRRLQELEPAATVEAPAAGVTATGVRIRPPDLTDVEIRALPPHADTPVALEALVGAIGRVDEATLQSIRSKCNERINHFRPNLANEGERRQGYLLLRGVSRDRQKEVRDRLLPHFTEVGRLQELVQTRNTESRPEERRALQFLLDSAVVSLLGPIVKDIKAIEKDQLLLDPKRPGWIDELLQLYLATDIQNPDKTSDTVSLVLEYVLYQGRNSAEKGGKKGYEKYKTFLAEQGVRWKYPGLKPPEKQEYSYGRKRVISTWGTQLGSPARMAEDWDALTTRQLLDPADDRIQRLKYEFSIP